MYKELFILLLGIIIGIIVMYYIMRSSLGDDYAIDAKIKNKKGVMKENIFEGNISEQPKKKKFLKRIFTKKEKL